MQWQTDAAGRVAFTFSCGNVFLFLLFIVCLFLTFLTNPCSESGPWQCLTTLCYDINLNPNPNPSYSAKVQVEKFGEKASCSRMQKRKPKST